MEKHGSPVIIEFEYRGFVIVSAVCKGSIEYATERLGEEFGRTPFCLGGPCMTGVGRYRH